MTDQITFKSTNDPTKITVVVTGAGEATVIGEFTSYAEYTVDVNYLKEFLSEKEILTGLHFTLTTSNGDKIEGTYSVETSPVPGTRHDLLPAQETFSPGHSTGQFKGVKGATPSKAS